MGYLSRYLRDGTYRYDQREYGTGKLRVDGLMVHDMALMQVKSPRQSKGEWEVYNVVGSIAGKDAFPPLNPDCPLVAKT